AGRLAAGLLPGAGARSPPPASPVLPAAGAPTAATPSPSPSSPSFRLPLPHRLPFRIGSMIPSFAGPLGLGGLFGAIHGQYVAPKDGGGYQTIAFQSGKVTAVPSTSITLRRADRYTPSYLVNTS